MRFFINELSIQGQFRNVDDIEAAVNSILNIFDKIKVILNGQNNLQSTDNTLLFDMQFRHNERFWESIQQIRKKEAKDRFKLLIKNLVSWNNTQLHNLTDRFVVENLNNLEVQGTSIAEATELMLSDSLRKCFIINFIRSSFSSHGVLQIVKNGDINNKTSLNTFCDKSQIDSVIHIPYDHYIRNNPGEFINTGKHCSKCGTPIYMDSKNRFWVLDSFHKTHYEIYNSIKEHLGIADLNGNVDRTNPEHGRKLHPM